MQRFSIIVPCHNRQAALLETLVSLGNQPGFIEVIVVDDGSSPPLVVPNGLARIVRTNGVERSRARNLGAQEASGSHVLFLDDDLTLDADFLDAHARGHAEFQGALCVGRIVLPDAMKATTFGRFRIALEAGSQGRPRGYVAEANFCTAANMSIQRDAFLRLGGFDPALSSGEDQDFALRWTTSGGRVAYLPDATVIHRDENVSIKDYCRRHEWGAEALAPFLLRHPSLPANVERLLTARRPVWSLSSGLRFLLSRRLVLSGIVAALQTAPLSRAPDWMVTPLFRLALGLALFRGFRTGLRNTVAPPPPPVPLLNHDVPSKSI